MLLFVLRKRKCLYLPPDARNSQGGAGPARGQAKSRFPPGGRGTCISAITTASRARAVVESLAGTPVWAQASQGGWHKQTHPPWSISTSHAAKEKLNLVSKETALFRGIPPSTANGRMALLWMSFSLLPLQYVNFKKQHVNAFLAQ